MTEVKIGFKKTLTGEIPEKWEMVCFGDACNQRNEIIQPSGKGEHKFVGLEHINPGEIRIHDYQLDTDVKSSKFRFQKGDILYGKLRPYLDKAVIADFDGICSTDLLVLTNTDNKALAEFLIYLIHSNQFIQNSISSTSGTNHPRTSWKKISKFKFGLPPLPEQRRIAEVLGTVDSAIQKVGGAIESTERLKKGLMQRLLTRGIGHEKFKESEVGRVPEEWEVARLGDAADDFVGGGTPSTTNPDYWNGKIAWMTSSHINGRIVNSGQRLITEKGLKESSTHLIPKDNLLVATRVGIGKAAINSIDVAISQDLTGVIIKKDKANADYIYWFLLTNLHKLKSLAQGSTIKGILKDDLANLKIPLPPLPEQRRIAKVLSAVDRKLELERRRKEKLERVKKGLMNELLTGRKRVKVMAEMG